MAKWNKVKLTVVKKYLTEDLAEQYVTKELKDKGYGACDEVALGAQYILEEPNKPEGFCSWAWADIKPDLTAIMAGGNFPWINQDGVGIVSCSDGLRPVVFLIERI